MSAQLYLCPEEHCLRKSFWNTCFFRFRKLVETFPEIWRENSEKVARTPLYVPGENHEERNSLLKKIPSYFWILCWSFPGLWLNFFDRIVKSEMYVSKGNFVSKILPKKNWSICNIGNKLKNFWMFGKKVPGCQNIILRVQKFYFMENIFSGKKIKNFSSEFCRKFPKIFQNFFCRVVKTCFVRVHMIILTKSFPLRPDIVSILFVIDNNLREKRLESLFSLSDN